MTDNLSEEEDLTIQTLEGEEEERTTRISTNLKTIKPQRQSTNQWSIIWTFEELQVKQFDEHLKQFPWLRKNPLWQFKQIWGLIFEHVLQFGWQTARTVCVPTLTKTCWLDWTNAWHELLPLQDEQYPGQAIHSCCLR